MCRHEQLTEKRPEDRIEVYSALRDEAVRLQGEQNSFVLGIYTVYAALLAVGANNLPFLFSTYLAILTFQSMINYKNWQITKISLYIRIFFEETRDDMHWSSLHSFPDYLEIHRKMSRSPEGILRNTGGTVLAFLTTILIIHHRISQYSISFHLPKEFFSFIRLFLSHEFVCILLASALFILCLWLNLRYFTFGKKSIIHALQYFVTGKGNDVDPDSMEMQLQHAIEAYYKAYAGKPTKAVAAPYNSNSSPKNQPLPDLSNTKPPAI